MPRPRWFLPPWEEGTAGLRAIGFCVGMVALLLAVGRGGCQGFSGSCGNDSQPLRCRDGKVEGSWETIVPRRQVNVRRATQVVGGVIGPRWDQEAGPLHFRTRSGHSRCVENLVTNLVMPPGPISPGATAPAVVAFGVQDLVTERAPAIMFAIAGI